MVGWITPKGKFFKCNVFKHFEIIEECDEIPKELKEKVDELHLECESIAESCQELADSEGHINGEWHRYEMARDDAQTETWSLLLGAGFIRVGELGDTVHFEGLPAVLKSQYNKCMSYAESRDKYAKFKSVET